MYGDEDWVRNLEKDAPQKLINANRIKHGESSNLYLISNSGHNLHDDNP